MAVDRINPRMRGADHNHRQRHSSIRRPCPQWLPLATFAWQVAAWAVLSDHSGASFGLAIAATWAYGQWRPVATGLSTNGVINQQAAGSWFKIWWRPWYWSNHRIWFALQIIAVVVTGRPARRPPLPVWGVSPASDRERGAGSAGLPAPKDPTFDN